MLACINMDLSVKGWRQARCETTCLIMQSSEGSYRMHASHLPELSEIFQVMHIIF